jgi:crotonobetainyl-CoA:carnitine CoA-transferase CaiB-like acyl-CoA transferase
MLPLEGIRVVEVAQNLAGPMAAEILAHMGADVVKVERPEGDDARKWGPPFWKGVSPGFLAVNANKRGISLDLKDPEAVAWLLDFLGTADVLVQNLRPGSLDELGLGPDVVRARHPRLVYCSVWAFGRSGPGCGPRWARSPGSCSASRPGAAAWSTPRSSRRVSRG